MEQLPKPEPLISNKMLGDNMDVYEASLEENTSHDVTMRLNMTTAYGAGARNVRDIYEAELQSLRSQVEAMRVSGDDVLDLVSSAQSVLSRYLQPDGHTKERCIEILLELFDGPRQRKVEAAWTASLNPTPATQDPT